MFPFPSQPLDPNLQALGRLQRETRTGATGTTWDLTDNPVEGFELVFKNGLLLNPDGADYTLSGKRIIFAVSLTGSDRTTAVYYFRGN